MSILYDLYSLTYKGEFLTPITEKYLRKKQLQKKIERKATLYKTLKTLIKKDYVMRTFKDGKYYYAMSPEGKKVYDLLELLSELDFYSTRSERSWDRAMGKYYTTMCCKCSNNCFIRVDYRIDEGLGKDKRFAKDNLCVRCKVDQERRTESET